MSSNSLSARPVVITGCSSGIGRTTAERLARTGRNVYATARRLESIRDLEAAGCKILPLDVTDEDSMRGAVERVERAEGPVGSLINNAGYSQSGTIEEIPMEWVRRQFETNVFGLVRMCQLVLPGMRRAGGGRIFNLSSMGGKLTFPGLGFYHATKHAVESLSDALLYEVAGFGVRVVVVEPGIIRTEFDATSTGSMASSDDGPYAALTAAVSEVTKNAYDADSPAARLGGGPEAVARTIERALSVPNPRPRYTVTPSARLLMAVRSALPDRAWDAMLRAQYPQPGR